MDTFKFENLKKRVKEHLPWVFTSKTIMWNGENVASSYFALAELIESGRVRNLRGNSLGNALYDEFIKEAIPIIDRWDVRDARSLVALIPNIFPSWVESGRFTVEYDADGEWVLQKAA